jgi:hypothetical protein
MRHRDGDGPELLVDLPPKDERPLIEQYVTPLTIDVREQDGLHQPVPVVEGGELHRLVLERVHRLGGGEHPGDQNVLADVPVELGAPAEAELVEVVGIEPHRMDVSGEAERRVLLAPPPLGVVRPEHGDGGREVVEPVAGPVVG